MVEFKKFNLFVYVFIVIYKNFFLYMTMVYKMSKKVEFKIKLRKSTCYNIFCFTVNLVFLLTNK